MFYSVQLVELSQPLVQKVKSFFIRQFNELTDDLSDKNHVEIITNSDDVTFKVARSTLELITLIDYIVVRINGEAYGDIKFDNGAFLETEEDSFADRPRINDVVVDAVMLPCLCRLSAKITFGN